MLLTCLQLPHVPIQAQAQIASTSEALSWEHCLTVHCLQLESQSGSASDPTPSVGSVLQGWAPSAGVPIAPAYTP